jgi:hypothetical protein
LFWKFLALGAGEPCTPETYAITAQLAKNLAPKISLFCPSFGLVEKTEPINTRKPGVSRPVCPTDNHRPRNEALPDMFGQFIELTDRTSLDDLARNIAAMRVESAAFRQATRFQMRLKLSIFLTQRGATKGQLRAECEDISESGMGLVLAEALQVGNDYWIAFDKEPIEIPGPVHARCVRVRMLDQGKFETGFRFYNGLILPGSVKQSHDDDIL